MSPRLFSSPCGRSFIVHKDKVKAAKCPDCGQHTASVTTYKPQALKDAGKWSRVPADKWVDDKRQRRLK